MLAVRVRGTHNGRTVPNPVLGVRVSAGLRAAMARVCQTHGLKMGEFVETAIRERMERLRTMDRAGRAAKARGKRSPEETRKAWDELSARVTRLWQGPGGAVEAIREQRE